MNPKIKGIFLLICAVLIVGLALSFFSRATPIEVQMPLVTREMVEENQAAIRAAAEKRQNAAAARKRAELEMRLYQCQADSDCIIVDKDPCGCLKGPEGVTAINSSMSLEFSRLVQEKSSLAEVCPSVASAEKECSATARPVCQQNVCKIVY